MSAHVVLDIARLLSSVRRGVPSGVERVELAYARHLLSRHGEQMGFAARLTLPVYKPRTFLSPGYQDNLGWGYATALGAQDALLDRAVVSINGDGGFMYTANELATAVLTAFRRSVEGLDRP